MKIHNVTSTSSVQRPSFNLEALENYIQESMEKWNIPGLSIAMVKDGSTILSKGYGIREAGKSLPVDEHTLFPIAGSTKSFTAAALAILVGEGKINWNDRIRDLLPTFLTGNDLVTHYATVLDALVQRTGLQDEPSLFMHPRSHLSRSDVLNRMKHIQSAQEFRACYSGNSLVIVAAGEIIPALTGISWDDFVSERLFKPVGMTDSVTGSHRFGENNTITTLHCIDGESVIPVPHPQNSNVGPALSIYSSASDMAKWLHLQLNHGKVGDQAVISEQEITTMRTSHMAANIKFPGMVNHFCNAGLGLLISDSCSGHKIYHYGGGVEGTESYYAVVPELDLGVAIMGNANKSLPQMLTPWIIDRYTDAPYRDWVNEVLTSLAETSAASTSPTDKLNAIADPSKKPTLPMETYAGLYSNPVLGDMVVRMGAECLSFTLDKTYKGYLKHSHYDTFYPEVMAPYSGKNVLKGAARFSLNETGEVASLFIVGKEFKRAEFRS